MRMENTDDVQTKLFGLALCLQELFRIDRIAPASRLEFEVVGTVEQTSRPARLQFSIPENHTGTFIRIMTLGMLVEIIQDR